MLIKNVFRSLKQSFFPNYDRVELADTQLVFGFAKSRIPSVRQLTYLTQFLTNSERQTARLFFGVMVFAILALVVGFFVRGSGEPAWGGVYTEGVVGYPEHVNPVLAVPNSPASGLAQLIYRRLFMWDSEGRLAPDLVESYEVLGDGKAYHMRLRRDVVWEDGEPFDADDVLYTLSVIQDATYRSPFYSRFSSVKLEKKADFDIVFSLPETSGDFLSALTIGILPEHVWSAIPPQGFALTSLNQKPIGNGPFRFVRFLKSNDGLLHTYRFKRNELFGGERPYLDEVTFKFYPSVEEAQEALLRSNIDGLGGLSKKGLQGVRDSGDIRLFDVDVPEVVALFMNLKGTEALRSRDVRSALSLAAPRQSIVEELLDHSGYPIVSPLLKGFEGYESALHQSVLNIQVANEMMEKLGWKASSQGFRKKENAELRFSISTLDSHDFVEAAEALRESFEKVGVRTETVFFEQESGIREAIRNKSYDALLVKVNIGLTGDLFPLFHSSQAARGYNLSQYVNRDFDLLVQRARDANSSEDRAKLNRDMHDLLLRDVPALFLYSPAYSYAQHKRVKGFSASRISGSDGRFSSITRWYVREKLF